MKTWYMIYDIFILNWPSRGCDRLLDDCLGFQIQQETAAVCKFKISHLCFQFMKIIFIWENWPNWLSDGEEGNWGTPWFYSSHEPVTSNCVIGNVSMVVKGKDEIEFIQRRNILFLWVSTYLCNVKGCDWGGRKDWKGWFRTEGVL